MDTSTIDFSFFNSKGESIFSISDFYFSLVEVHHLTRTNVSVSDGYMYEFNSPCNDALIMVAPASGQTEIVSIKNHVIVNSTSSTCKISVIFASSPSRKIDLDFYVFAPIDKNFRTRNPSNAVFEMYDKSGKLIFSLGDKLLNLTNIVVTGSTRLTNVGNSNFNRSYYGGPDLIGGKLVYDSQWIKMPDTIEVFMKAGIKEAIRLPSNRSGMKGEDNNSWSVQETLQIAFNKPFRIYAWDDGWDSGYEPTIGAFVEMLGRCASTFPMADVTGY